MILFDGCAIAAMSVVRDAVGAWLSITLLQCATGIQLRGVALCYTIIAGDALVEVIHIKHKNHKTAKEYCYDDTQNFQKLFRHRYILIRFNNTSNIIYYTPGA